MTDIEARVTRFIAALVAMVMLSIAGGCTYSEKDNEQTKRGQIEMCLANGGEWRLQQIDDDYGPEHVCVKPGADMGKRHK